MSSEPMPTMDETVPMEEGMPNETRREAGKAFQRKTRLSTVSCKYDLDGDGQLDDAEQAMRDLDKSGRGYLKNDEIYKLMKTHLKTQEDLFSLKRVVIGLTCFTAVLAVSNLGTAWAAAVLAKDTASRGGALVDQASGEVLATKTRPKMYSLDPSGIDANRRDLTSLQPLSFTLGQVKEMDGALLTYVERGCDSITTQTIGVQGGATKTAVANVDSKKNDKKYTFSLSGDYEGGSFEVTCPPNGQPSEPCWDISFVNVPCPEPDVASNGSCPSDFDDSYIGQDCTGYERVTDCYAPTYGTCECDSYEGTWMCIPV